MKEELTALEEGVKAGGSWSGDISTLKTSKNRSRATELLLAEVSQLMDEAFERFSLLNLNQAFLGWAPWSFLSPLQESTLLRYRSLLTSDRTVFRYDLSRCSSSSWGSLTALWSRTHRTRTSAHPAFRVTRHRLVLEVALLVGGIWFTYIEPSTCHQLCFSGLDLRREGKGHLIELKMTDDHSTVLSAVSVHGGRWWSRRLGLLCGFGLPAIGYLMCPWITQAVWFCEHRIIARR